MKPRDRLLLVALIFTLATIGTAFLLASTVTCTEVDRTGTVGNCTGWTGWYEF